MIFLREYMDNWGRKMVIVTKKKYYKIIFYISVLAVVAAALIRGFGSQSENSIWPSKNLIFLSGKWEQRSGGDDGVYEVAYRIPEECGDDLILSLESYWCNLKVFLDGKELYSYEDAYEEQGTIRQWIELPDGAAGRLLALRLEDSRELVRQTISGNTYLGEKGAVFYQFFKENLYAFVFGLGALLMSCVLFFSSVYLRHKSFVGLYRGTEYLTGFILLTGIWIVTDSQLLQIICRKTGLISLSSFISFMAMPVFLLLFVQEMMVRRRRSLDILCVLFSINLVCCLLLYLFRILPLFRSLFVTHLLIVLAVIIVLKCGIQEIMKYHNMEQKLVLAGFGILSLFGCAALVVFYYNPSYRYSYLFSIGMAFFAAFLVAAAFKKIYYHLERSANIEAYRNLAYVDTLTGILNRNAFMEEQEREVLPENFACLMFDINNLKIVNDQYGHQEGDKLLRDAADSLRNTFGQIGKCYRIGGDEFAVIIQETSGEEIERELKRWESCVQKINRTRSHPMEIAWGYSLRESKDITEKDVFAEADARMYRRKQAMKERGTFTIR